MFFLLSTAQGRSIYSQGQWPLVRRVFTTSLNKHPAIDMKYFQQYHCCIRSLSQKCQTPRSGSHRPANHDAIKLFRIFIIETTGALEEQNWNIRTRFLSTP